MFRLVSRAVWVSGVMLVAIAAGPPVEAADTCVGTIVTSLLHPLPRSMVVMGADISIASSTTPELTRRFVDGLRQAGVTVADEGNVTLNITVSVTAPSTTSNIVSGRYRGFEWVKGG